MSGSSLNPSQRQVSMDQVEWNFLGTPSKWEIVFIKYPRAVSGQCRENSRNREKCDAAYLRRIPCQASIGRPLKSLALVPPRPTDPWSERRVQRFLFEDSSIILTLTKNGHISNFSQFLFILAIILNIQEYIFIWLITHFLSSLLGLLFWKLSHVIMKEKGTRVMPMAHNFDSSEFAF